MEVFFSKDFGTMKFFQNLKMGSNCKNTWYYLHSKYYILIMTEILRICTERLIKIKMISNWNLCFFINIQIFKIYHLSCVFIQIYFAHYLSFGTDIFNNILQSMPFCPKEGAANPFKRDTVFTLSAVILRVSNRDQYLFRCTRCSVNSSREAAPSLRALCMTHRVNKQAKEGKEDS